MEEEQEAQDLPLLPAALLAWEDGEWTEDGEAWLLMEDGEEAWWLMDEAWWLMDEALMDDFSKDESRDDFPKDDGNVFS